jgi:YesN/AraC family two-component response regulator
MEKAEELLKKEKLSIKEIAARSGYNDYYYFNKVFKKCHNLTASEFREKLK